MGQVVQVSSLPWGTFTNATKGGRAPSGSQFCGGRKVGWQSRTVAGHIAPQEAETACEEREQEVGLGWGLSPPSHFLSKASAPQGKAWKPEPVGAPHSQTTPAAVEYRG